MPRRDRRSRGKRALRRLIDAKYAEFIDLYGRGYGAETLASKLQITLAEAEFLLSVAKAEDEQREERIA